MTGTPVLETTLPNLPVRRGKVRDVYDLGETLLIVSTDRISAFDWVLPTGIPDKGRILTGLSEFWFARLAGSHHLITTNLSEMNLPATIDTAQLTGRTMLVRKTNVVPIECVVRGYLAGSGWRAYHSGDGQQSGKVCGVELPAGLRESDQLPEPIFTPATKEELGAHDINITFDEMAERVGRDLAEELRRRSIEIYQQGAEHARQQGIIIADTKFEFGQTTSLPSPPRGGAGGGESLLLIDEVMTPDSSRFWPAHEYQPGGSPPSFDKQFVRDWLSTSGWDKNSPPPKLPDEIVTQTRAKYVEAYERLTGKTFDN